jgi:hypothetical protein
MISIAACNRRLRELVQEGSMLRKIEVVVEAAHDQKWNPATLAYLHVPDCRRKLVSYRPHTVHIMANQASIEWLCDWELLRGPALDSVAVEIRSMGNAALEPALPAAWRRLRDLLSPIAAEVDCNYDEEEAALEWVTVCPRLQSLNIDTGDNVSLLGRFPLPRRLFVNLIGPDEARYEGHVMEDRLTDIAPLKGVKELDMDANYGFTDPASFAPLAALTAVTALTLSLAEWDTSFGPLPSALERLTLKLLPLPYAFELFPYDYNHVHDVSISLACPGFKESLGGAADSVKHLDITLEVGEAGLVRPMREQPTPAIVNIELALAPDSIPCAFPALEEFSFTLTVNDTD